MSGSKGYYGGVVMYRKGSGQAGANSVKVLLFLCSNNCNKYLQDLYSNVLFCVVCP